MKYLLFFLLAVFSLGELTRINVINSELVVHLNDIVVVVIGLIWVTGNMGKIRGIVSNSKLAKAILVFFSLTILSLVLNINNFTFREILISSLYPIRWLAYAIIFFVFKDISNKDKTIGLRSLVIVTAIIAVAGLIQYVFIPDTRFLNQLNWDDHYFRLISVFMDPGFTGTVLVMGLTVIFNLKFVIFNQYPILNLKLLKPLLMIIVYIAIALTYSRATYLMFLTVFAVISWYKKSWKILAVAALVLAITIPLLPRHFGEGNNLSRGYSVWGRINNWKQTIIVWTKAPVTGIGFNTYRYFQDAPLDSHAGAGADSSLLLILATTGIAGFLAYLWVVREIWGAGSKSVIFKASFAGILVASWFNNTLLYPAVMEWLWLSLAFTADT